MYKLVIFLVTLGTNCVSEKSKPELYVVCLYPYSGQRVECPPDIRRNDNNHSVLFYSSIEIYEFNCTANYPLRWEFKLFENVEYPRIKSSRVAGDIYNKSSYIYNIRFRFDRAHSGALFCRSVEDPGIFSRVYIFTQRGPSFVSSGKTMTLIPPYDTTVVPCVGRYVNLSAFIEYREIASGSGPLQNEIAYKKLNWTYRPEKGFIVPENQRLIPGEYKCSVLDKDDGSVVFQFLPWLVFRDPWSNHFHVNKTRVSITLRDDRVSCSQSYPFSEIRSLFDMKCRDPPNCQLFQQCIEQNQACPEYGILHSTQCQSSTQCQELRSVFTLGASICWSETRNASEIGYHFYGLDRKQHLYSEYKEGKIEENALYKMDNGSSVLFTDQQEQFYCTGLRFLYSESIKFIVAYKNGSESSLPAGSFETSEKPKVEEDKTDTIEGGVRLRLTEDMIKISCYFPLYESYEWANASRKFIVKAARAPSITNRGSGIRAFYVGDRGRTLSCRTDGYLSPVFLWFHQGLEIPQNGRNSGISSMSGEIESVLKFPEIKKKFQGQYTCMVSNRVGADNFTFSVEVKESAINSGTIAGLVMAFVAFFVAMFVGCYKMRRRYLDAEKRLRNLTEEEIRDFEFGNPELIEGQNGTMEETLIYSLPFNTDYKLLEQDVTIDRTKVLGKGAYGVVIQGMYRENVVAVKTALPNVDVSYFKALLSEIKVMGYIGNHENIVHFHGALTGRIRERIVYMVLELSPYGNLNSHLKTLRANCSRGEKTYDEIEMVNLAKLSSWSHQIAAGMEFLGSKNVIHGDLATRNVLLFGNNVVKITDFGLARQLFENSIYNKTNQAPLPWRWMALESLEDMIFSVKSDIWSYGVTVWEIFSLAQTPFPGLNWSTEFVQNLQSGKRMYKPKLASAEIYQLLLRCWDPEPDSRPSFGQLKSFFGNLQIQLAKAQRNSTDEYYSF